MFPSFLIPILHLSNLFFVMKCFIPPHFGRPYISFFKNLFRLGQEVFSHLCYEDVTGKQYLGNELHAMIYTC